MTPDTNMDFLDELWKEAQGKIEIGNIKIRYNVRSKVGIEQWKKEWIKKVFGKSESKTYVDKNGRITMPDCGII